MFQTHFTCECGGPSIENQRLVLQYVNELRLHDPKKPMILDKHHTKCKCGRDYEWFSRMIIQAVIENDIDLVSQYMWYYTGRDL